jgi:hypothetical protein
MHLLVSIKLRLSIVNPATLLRLPASIYVTSTGIFRNIATGFVALQQEQLTFQTWSILPSHPSEFNFRARDAPMSYYVVETVASGLRERDKPLKDSKVSVLVWVISLISNDNDAVHSYRRNLRTADQLDQSPFHGNAERGATAVRSSGSRIWGEC